MTSPSILQEAYSRRNNTSIPEETVDDCRWCVALASSRADFGCSRGGSFRVAMSLPHLLDTRSWSYLSVYPYCPISFSSTLKSLFPQTVHFPDKVRCISRGSQSSFAQGRDDAKEDLVIGDCVVFEEDIFEDPYLKSDSKGDRTVLHTSKGRKKLNEVEPENLVPEQWKEVQAEINLTKNEKRKIAQELEFGSQVEKRKQGYAPLRDVNLEEYKTYREAKLAQLNPVVLDNLSSFPVKEHNEEAGDDGREWLSERVKPKNPRWAVYGRGLEDVADFFNSESYDPDKKSEGKRTLFTREEKFLLNKRLPDLETATSDKWLPLHTLAASGEFDLLDALLKHNVDINAEDQAIVEYLLRESANPFVRDEEGASLMHYAIQTASSRAIKILLLYNVDINLQDNDRWTPLHLAVQSRRTDLVRLLLIKGADKTIKNKDGLTALELCLYSGRDSQTYMLIKLLKLVPKSP